MSVSARGGGEPDDECEHSVHAEHWPLDQAHLVPQSLAFFGHQDLQSPDVVQENTSSLETSAVAGAVFAGTESIAESRTSIVGLARRKRYLPNLGFSRLVRWLTAHSGEGGGACVGSAEALLSTPLHVGPSAASRWMGVGTVELSNRPWSMGGGQIYRALPGAARGLVR